MTEDKDDQAIGHTVRLALGNPKSWALIAGLAGLGGFGGWLQRGSSDTTKMLRRISADVVTVKIQTSAIMQTMPPAQQERAQKIVDLQLAALKIARDSQ